MTPASYRTGEKPGGTFLERLNEDDVQLVYENAVERGLPFRDFLEELATTLGTGEKPGESGEGLTPMEHRYVEATLPLRGAVIAELTHGGVNDEIAQVATSLGALARCGVTEEEATKLAKQLDKARADCRARLEAVLRSTEEIQPPQTQGEKPAEGQSIQRWAPAAHADPNVGGFVGIPRPDGEFVRYEDHLAALAAQPNPADDLGSRLREAIEAEVERLDTVAVEGSFLAKTRDNLLAAISEATTSESREGGR